MLTPARTLQWILWQWLAATADEHLGVRRCVIAAMHDIMRCRTGALGARLYECPTHGEELVPNSCQRRDCPMCVGRRSYKWAAAVEGRLLACDHYHVVFTLPDTLHPYWRHNRSLMADLLLRSVSATLKALLADPRYMGGVPAILGVLHTHGGALTLHPHVHILVSAVGLTREGALAHARTPGLLPYRVLRRAFQMDFLHRLATLADHQDFHLPKGTTAPQLRALLARHFAEPDKRWNAKVFPREDPRRVVRYLSRTVFGGPIRNSRIRSVTGRNVVFRYHDWHDHDPADGPAPEREMSLSLDAFVRRWADHVPDPGFKTVRHWGLLAPGQLHRLDLARALLHQAPSPVSPEPDADAELEPTVRCPRCRAVLSVRELPPAPVVFSPAASRILRARGSPLFVRAAA